MVEENKQDTSAETDDHAARVPPVKDVSNISATDGSS